ncbi:hypothetical protein [uncultured Prevotella sp.]|uniref:hypothetical protein n=1 Tax=uncultured Prevotella sp. TaxID=159272 RepID=UPI0028047607|nr:hypothetical protein [uncultured Prevotella sp.]
MKKSIKSLLALLLLLGAMVEMKAADVYLLTAQTINGTLGKYEVPSNHPLAPNTSYGSNVYSLKITSMPETGFSFRIGVSGWDKQMQPYNDSDPLTINEEGTQNPISYTITGDCYGSNKLWKVSYTAGEYEYLTVNVDITEGTTRRVWIEGKKASAGGSGEPVVRSATDIEPGYYLVGNFFSPYNKGGEFNPGGDGATIDYTKHVYFKFEEQKDKSYAFSIPACLTAHAQILAVDEYDNKMVYGPGEVYNLHGAKDNTSVCPSTNGAVGTICGTTAAKKLVGSVTMAEDNNYWNLVTRNDGVTDDDGMYTFSFKLDKDGNPSDWQVKHDANTRVTYLIGNMEGATAQPLYDTRTGGVGAFSDNMEAPLYFDGSNSYWAIDYIVNTVSDNGILAQAKTATPDIHETGSVHNNSGTHDKLFFLGNGGVDYNSTSEYRDKVWANQKPFTLNLHGIKRIQYNPNKGHNGLSTQDGSYGLSGSIQVIGGGNANAADILINTMSMIGDAVEGTYDAASGKWMYTSTAGDMKYDANERCFSLTISTVGDKYANSHFRFVANNDAHQNWGETDINISGNKGFARADYNDATDADNHSCMADDPNDVQFRKTAREDEEGFGSTTPNQKDILWNRPEGIWTVRFYPELDKEGNDISRYTISGTKVIKMPFTRCVGKFIRTYSNNVAMAPVDDNVKVYEAYKYGTPVNAENPQSQGTVYLRQLNYIPANMGVVLVGKQPAEGTFSDGDKLNYSLREAPAEMLVDNYKAVWTKAGDYVNDEWNNYLKPTVTAIDNLGNADTDADGKILHRFFGLANFHSTKYYKENLTGDDYIGFFRLTQNGRSGANKAYLSIPANNVVDGGVGATFGYIDFNGQFLGNETDDPKNPSLAKMAIVFDDEDDGGSTTTVTEVKPNSTDGNASFYTLQGVKVSRPVKGVYIYNGKKFIK